MAHTKLSPFLFLQVKRETTDAVPRTLISGVKENTVLCSTILYFVLQAVEI
jgi:hypothetical protein